MKTYIKYFLIGLSVFVMLLAIEFQTSKPQDWTPSFSGIDRVPYGCYAVFHFLTTLFPEQMILTRHEPIYEILKHPLPEPANYIFINSVFNIDQHEARDLIKLISRGNTVFIAAENFQGQFSKSLNLETDVHIEMKSNPESINFTNPQIKAPRDYYYPRRLLSFYFKQFDSSTSAVLGVNRQGDPNFIQIKMGKGMLFLSTVPYAFTNYNMFWQNNYEYIFKALSYLPVQTSCWDEYYKVRRQLAASSPLSYILSQPALKRAYYLSLLGIILFIFFGSRRRQRVIPIIKPLPNTTLDFISTIVHLYLRKRDHKNLALKKINHFLEYLRSHLFIRTNILSDDLYQTISQKTAIQFGEIKNLFQYLQYIHHKEQISPLELLQLDHQIEEFYRKIGA